MIKRNTILFNTIILTLLSACSPTISNFNSYLPQVLPKTDYMPSPDLAEGKAPKIVVFNFDDDASEVAKQAALGESITVAVENTLSQNRLAEIVDRKAAAKLEKEIALAEMNKTGSYKGPRVADYAISGSIGNAGFTNKYSSGMVIPNGNGGFTRIPPKFTYTADVSGSLKVYELPSMQVVENFEFNGKKVKTEEVKTNNNVSIGGLIEFGGQKVEGLTRDDGLVRNAGIEAIDNISFDIKNFFAKKAFILEKRTLKKNAIFKISAGSSEGIKQGDKFDVIGKYEINNALTGKTEIERRIIARGVVADKIDPNSSWVLIDDEDEANLIRLGDMVQFKYKRSFGSQMMKFAGSMNF